MKVLTFLLVLINALFFAFSQGLSGNEDAADAQRTRQQVRPEQIEVTSRGTPPALPASKTASCLALPQLSRNAAEQLLAGLGKQVSGIQDWSLTALDADTWWVAIPPLASAAEATKKGEQLRELGIAAFGIVEDGSTQQHAISLGIFDSEGAASSHLATLKAQGVRSARLNPRPRKSLLLLQIRVPEARMTALRQALASLQPDSQPRACP